MTTRARKSLVRIASANLLGSRTSSSTDAGDEALGEDSTLDATEGVASRELRRRPQAVLEKLNSPCGGLRFQSGIVALNQDICTQSRRVASALLESSSTAISADAVYWIGVITVVRAEGHILAAY